MENKKLTNCNQCPNHCPADALQCGRGRHYFEQLENPDKGKAEERGQNEHGEDHGHGHKEGHQHGHGEGRDYGRREGHQYGDSGFEHSKSDDLYSLMRGCGHYLHHNSGGHQGTNGEDQLFAVLDDGEKECLKGLLKKLLDSWK